MTIAFKIKKQTDESKKKYGKYVVISFFNGSEPSQDYAKDNDEIIDIIKTILKNDNK